MPPRVRAAAPAAPPVKPPDPLATTQTPKPPPMNAPPAVLPVPTTGNIPGHGTDRIAKAAAAIAAERAQSQAPGDTPPEQPTTPPASPSPSPPAPQVAATPPSPPPSPPPAEQPKPANMTPAQENAWQLLTQTERKLADQRAALKQERDAFEARQASMQAAQDELQTLKNRLQADFPGMARDFGWDDQRLAQNIISRYQPGHVDPTPPPAPQITQPASAQPAQPAYDKSWATQVENAIVSTNYTVAALAPEFDLIRSEPNGIQSAIQKALQYQAIGTSLTPQQALAMAQDELVEQHRALLAARDADPRWQRALGSPGSPAPQAPGQPAPQVTQPHTPGDEPITALNNDVSAAPTMPPVELGQPLTEAQRLERARQAVARLRAGQ